MKTKQASADIVKTTIRVKRELWNKVQHRSIDEKLSLQEIIETALETYLKAGRK